MAEHRPSTGRARAEHGPSTVPRASAGQAAREFAATFALCRDLLGNDHPDTVVALGNLAAAHVADGYPHRAVPLLERAVADRARLRGATHPCTLDARHALGVALRDTGDAVAASHVLRSVLADRTTVLGAMHPDTAGTHRALAAVDTAALPSA